MLRLSTATLGLTAVIRVRPRLRANPDHLRTDVLHALYRYFDPLRGGPERVQLERVRVRLVDREHLAGAIALDVLPPERLAPQHPEIVGHALQFLDEWHGDMMRSATHPFDPMRTVMRLFGM